MLFGQLRSAVEAIRDDISQHILRQKSQPTNIKIRTEDEVNAMLTQLHKEVLSSFQRVIDNTNCLERDLWETVGKKAAEENPTHASSWNHRD